LNFLTKLKKIENLGIGPGDETVYFFVLAKEHVCIHVFHTFNANKMPTCILA
jgi:hypothetical protein